MKTAIISDLHGNIWALEAILQYIAALEAKPKQIWFLGDIFGWGPKPYATYMKLDEINPQHWLVGNHDLAVAGNESLMGDSQASIATNRIHQNSLPDYIKKLVAANPSQKYLQDERILLSHALPNAGESQGKSVLDYDHLFAPSACTDGPQSILNRRDAIEPQCRMMLVGHTHERTGWVWNGEKWKMLVDSFGRDLNGTPPGIKIETAWVSISFSEIGERGLLVLNPGSAGFPRDGINSDGKFLTKFMLLDILPNGYQIEFCAVPYSSIALFDEWKAQQYPVSLIEQFEEEIIH